MEAVSSPERHFCEWERQVCLFWVWHQQTKRHMGVWLPSAVPCCAGLAAEALTLHPSAAKNAFQEQSKQVLFASDSESFFLAYGLRAFMRLLHYHKWVAGRIYRASLLAKVILHITVQLGWEYIWSQDFQWNQRGNSGCCEWLKALTANLCMLFSGKQARQEFCIKPSLNKSRE